MVLSLRLGHAHISMSAFRHTDKPATLRLIERAGMPSQDTHPTDCPGPHGTKVVRLPAC